MKICFISMKSYQLFDKLVDSTFGGAEVQISLLAKEMAKQGNDVHLIVADFGQKSIQQIENITIWKSFKLSDNLTSPARIAADRKAIGK